MTTLAPNSAILEKTRELCDLLLQSREYRESAAKIEAFFADESAQRAYRDFAELGERLHQRQQAGLLNDADVAGYDAELQALKSDPVTGEFMAAEEMLNGIVRQISRHVGKTLELGRLPEPSDLEESGCCNSGGCGCA